jgi:transcriptional regulator with PAS, ATPase and Fis domain
MTEVANMNLISSDRRPSPEAGRMLEGYDCPAILVSPDYRILATNQLYEEQFGEIPLEQGRRCFEVSHGYKVPCDQAGEDCPLAKAQASGHKERVLHIHRTPRGKEHVDVEMLPILDEDGGLICFVELLRAVPTAGAEDPKQMMVGTSKAFTSMLSKIARVSTSDASVLLLGGSGVGKELAATAIHRGSARKDKALVTLECAGLTDSLFESELFGHVKGAFTGADANKVGLVELADGGTLFLDEIGDVPLSMQVKLLRLLESGTYRRVGSAQVRTSNFRLVCATHKDILGMVRRGEFREDLYYRINVFPIRVPSLAERKEDLPLLIAALLKRISREKDYHLTDSAMKLLKAYSFPGNVRELRNLLTRAVVLTNTNLIESDVIKDCLDMATDTATAVGKESAESGPWVDLKTAEQRYLQSLMKAHNNDKELVAKIAGISLRSLYRKLDQVRDVGG